MGYKDFAYCNWKWNTFRHRLKLEVNDETLRWIEAADIFRVLKLGLTIFFLNLRRCFRRTYGLFSVRLHLLTSDISVGT